MVCFMYKLIIFDLDGTLIDSIHGIGYAMNRVLDRFGFPQHSAEEYKMLVGEGMKNLVYRALPEDSRSETMVVECYEQMKQEYSLHWEQNMELFDGVHKLLDELLKREILLGINTNKKAEVTKFVVDKYLSRWGFVKVIGEDSFTPRKPDPAGARLILEASGILPGEALYIGDSEIDMQTACKAGLDAIGVLWGYRSEEKLKQYHPKALIRHPLELLQVLGK